VITAADDYPLHQTSRPFRDPGTDRNLYDRFFFCGYPTMGDDAGSVYFAAAFGTYPGRNLVDAAFSVIVDGVQHNVRGSRLMGADRLNLRCGPVTISIIEPLRSLKVVVDAPEAGIKAELTFVARGPHFEEPHYRWAPGQLTVFDITRLTQNGTWEGFIEVGGRRLAVTPDVWLGTRDRSWGIRPIGARELNQAPDGPMPTFYWLWAPMNFPDCNVIFDVNENADGSRWHENAALSLVHATPEILETPATRSLGLMSGVEPGRATYGTHTYEIAWRPGSRHADGFDTRFDFPTAAFRFELQSTLTFYMHGIGYTHPTWGHGMFVGPDERTHDSIVLADVNEADLANNHVQILSHVKRTDRTTGVEAHGMGILEMLISGPHAPSGFTDYTDVRP
jgi:hypothetical protein